MSAVDLVLPEPAAAVPFSVRLAERHAKRAREIAAAPSDRRAHTRRRLEELDWLRLVRLTGGTGFGVKLVDLSEGGALLEVDAPLRPGVQLRLELIGGGLQAMVPLEVLRCYVASLRGESTIYHGACAFAHPIELPHVEHQLRSPSPAFVGTDAALSYLLQRCSGGRERSPGSGGGVTLERAELLHVLGSLLSRGNAGADALAVHTMDLLGTILPAIRRGDSRQEIVAALGNRVDRLPAAVQAQLRTTSARLAALVDHCATAERSCSVAAVQQSVATVQQIVQPAADDQATPAAHASTDAAFQKIVVRFADGQLLKGFTQDFHPSRPQFSLWRTINAAPSERTVVPIPKLKAIFFVKNFEGNPDYRERKTFTVRGQGRRLEVTFLDTEVILGTTLNYRADAQGFFVSPADRGANNSRIFVIASAVRRVRFL
jgi:hypothetical protein